jgi:hypothetical protein
MATLFFEGATLGWSRGESALYARLEEAAITAIVTILRDAQLTRRSGAA